MKPSETPSSENKFTPDVNNNPKKDPKPKIYVKDKYGLRPRSLTKRLQTKKHPIDSDEFKGKTAPLSKYRRKNANARERNRMREINQAFATLQGILPHFNRKPAAGMTKINTLKLAASYIQSLSDMLSDFDETPWTQDQETRSPSTSEEGTDMHYDTNDSLCSSSYNLVFECDFSSFDDIPNIPEDGNLAMLLDGENSTIL